MPRAEIKEPVGCGYCIHETPRTCPIHDSKVNYAKLGCPAFLHWSTPLGERVSKSLINTDQLLSWKEQTQQAQKKEK
jgi:hypothetical protein